MHVPGRIVLVVAGLCVLGAVRARAQNEPVTVHGTGGPWIIEGARRVPDVRFAPYRGREAIWLRNNTMLIKADLEFGDGTIEFDVLFREEADFFGVVFHRVEYGDEDNVYFRPFDADAFNAVQYAPHIGRSSTWQLYPEFNRPADLRLERWTHVRLVAWGGGMELYLDHDTAPTLVVPRLRARYAEGRVGFWARVNDEDEQWAAAIANVTITTDSRSPGGQGSLLEPTAWRLSDPIPRPSWTTLPDLDQREWSPAMAEPGGLINLTRTYGRLRGDAGGWTVFARRMLRASRPGIVRLDLGYTDDVTVFLNGRPLFVARNGWESRYPGYLGQITSDAESVFLDLTEGDNELVLAISDDQRFGWGFRVAIGDDERVLTDAPAAPRQ